MKKFTKGFTLIELLVVIAIIGLLASIVLVSLNSARAKGKDTRIISDVQQMRTAIEAGFNGYGFPDLTTNASCSGGTAITGNIATNANCIASGPDLTVIPQLVTDSTAQGGANSMFILTGVTGSNATSYAIRGRLVSSPNTFFCIDSTGKTNTLDNNAVSGAVCH